MELLIRLLLGVVFLIGGMFSYYGNSTENPVTGEKQRVGGLTARQEVMLGIKLGF